MHRYLETHPEKIKVSLDELTRLICFAARACVAHPVADLAAIKLPDYRATEYGGQQVAVDDAKQQQTKVSGSGDAETTFAQHLVARSLADIGTIVPCTGTESSGIFVDGDSHVRGTSVGWQTVCPQGVVLTAPVDAHDTGAACFYYEVEVLTTSGVECKGFCGFADCTWPAAQGRCWALAGYDHKDRTHDITSTGK